MGEQGLSIWKAFGLISSTTQSSKKKGGQEGKGGLGNKRKKRIKRVYVMYKYKFHMVNVIDMCGKYTPITNIKLKKIK